MINFTNSYIQLPDNFFQKVTPSVAHDPGLICFNHSLAKQLNIKSEGLEDEELAKIFSGEKILPGSEPLAMAYAGHQFGHFVPRLGDGRAILLGEVLAESGLRYDIQLKGAGQTAFSRRGDGRSSLGPVIREYLLSEAMYALGVPTTRALAAVTTGEQVQREAVLPGAVCTRVASSHLRVGTFEYFGALNQKQDLKTLCDYAINRHYPTIADAKDKYFQFLRAVAKRKLDLVAKWMGVGFIHGVMNTDNTSISGETIDFGPCAFMDVFSANKVFSSIDRHGRYAYSNQSELALWNLSALANALFPLLKDEDKDQEASVEKLQAEFKTLKEYYKQKYLEVMAAKLGIFKPKETDRKLVENFLHLLEEHKLDFTNSFRSIEFTQKDHPDFYAGLMARLESQPESVDQARDLRNKSNPFLIPRNHQVQKAIEQANEGDYSHFHYLNESFRNPYQSNEEYQELTKTPEASEVVTQTFCGT